MAKRGKEDAVKILDGISVAVLTSSSGDFRKVGEILSLFDGLSKMAEAEGWREIREAAKAGDILLTALMFQDGLREKHAAVMESVGRIVAVCQDACRGKRTRQALTRLLKEISGSTDVSFEDLAEDGQEAEASEGGEETPGARESILLDQDKDLYTDFVTESLEHLQAIEVKMVDLEARAEDREIINAIFRGFHTIKGVSGFLNLKDVNELSHRTETLLDLCRQGSLAVTPSLIDVVFEAIDALKGMVRDVSSKIAEGASERAPWGIRPILSHIEAVQSGTPIPGESDREEVPLLGDVLVEQGKVSRQEVEATVLNQLENPEHPPLGKILIDEKKVTPRDVAAALRVQKAGGVAVEAQDIRVDVRKLDILVDMVGELVISQSLVLNDSDVRAIETPSFYRNMSQLSRITSELQKIAMSMRMVPIRNTFQKMSRLVRDLARKSGKEVALLMEGEETEIDRNMVEEIHDPLVHMIRNSVDHGIELPAERAAQGKAPFGKITLRALHQGGCVILSVEDDGRGLNAEKILAKARERGLVGEKAEPPENEIYQLVFEPGFSTAEKVTDISGRGVGMDVVRKNVEKLRGTVEIRSQPQKGSTFSMKLPLTLAIIDGIVVRVGKERYVIPTNNVLESLRPKREEYFTVEGRSEIIKVRGDLLPLVRLDRLFAVPDGEQELWNALTVVIEHEGQRRALLVDELLGKQEVVIKGLGGGTSGARGISGGAIMGDGRVGLIIDVAGIFEMTGQKAACA